MIRLGIGILILLAIVLGGGGYLIGARHGRALERRWSTIVASAMRWRRLELQGDFTHQAELELTNLRTLLDAETDRRDRAYLALEERRS